MKSNRRLFLAGVAGIASGTMPGTAVADDQRTEEVDTADSDGNAEVREIEVFSRPDRKVLEDHKVVHSFGWRTERGESKHDLERIRDIPGYEFKIDGNRIENPQRYWKPIQDADDFYRVRWDYPRSPGETELGRHRFEVIIDFGDGFESKSLKNGETWSGRNKLSTEYEVMTETDFKRYELSESLEIVENKIEAREQTLQTLRNRRDQVKESDDIDIKIDSIMTDITILTSRREKLEFELQQLNKGSL